MAWFTKKEWKNRLAEFAGRRTLTDVATGASQVVDVARNEGTISQEGDAFSAANMNEFEQRILEGFTQAENATTELNQKIDDKINTTPTLLKTVTSFSETYKNAGVDWTQYKTLWIIAEVDWGDNTSSFYVFTIPTAIITINNEYAVVPYGQANDGSAIYDIELKAKFSSNNLALQETTANYWSIGSCKIYGE